MTPRIELAIASFDRYLAGLHSSLWGRAFDIHDADGRRKAAEWMIGEVAAWTQTEEGE